MSGIQYLGARTPFGRKAEYGEGSRLGEVRLKYRYDGNGGRCTCLPMGSSKRGRLTRAMRWHTQLINSHLEIRTTGVLRTAILVTLKITRELADLINDFGRPLFI
jgi:hypothetical protein